VDAVIATHLLVSSSEYLRNTEPDMGPFEIAPGTQWDWSESFAHWMFPPRDAWSRYTGRAIRKYPRMGNISARSALTIHRRTKNISRKARPVLVLGVDAPGAGSAERHDLAVTKDCWDRDHLACPRGGRADPDHPEAHHRRACGTRATRR
jgi:hypothetical protein